MSEKPTVWQVLISVLGAFFGVQNSRVRERDFKQGQFWWVYVWVGLFFVFIFIIILILLAKLVLYLGS